MVDELAEDDVPDRNRRGATGVRPAVHRTSERSHVVEHERAGICRRKVREHSAEPTGTFDSMPVAAVAIEIGERLETVVLCHAYLRPGR
jgi:hypothetical protein